MAKRKSIHIKGMEHGAPIPNGVAIGNGASNGVFTNSVALGAASVNTANNQVTVGGQTAATARVVTGVAAGAVSATSFDAVNGSQLFAVTQDITALENDVALLFLEDIAINNRIDDANDRAASGSAVAIAMGGAMFLPDKTFNLTGNMGLYRGAWAGAMNVGAMISPNAAINAGIGAGFNKKGKVGARAGFTFGW